MNRFFSIGLIDGEGVPTPPARVYAKIDQFEPDAGPAGDDLYIVFFDTVDADWFDHPNNTVDQSDPNAVDRWIKGAPISVISMVGLEEVFPGGPVEGGWYELQLSDQAGGTPILHYLGLFADPIRRYAISTKRLPPAFDRKLGKTFDLPQVNDASTTDIQQALSKGLVASIEAAAIYDVGQGNCNALLQDPQIPHPMLYYDFGGGVLANKHTFPAALTAFCITKNPPIVLSHWDWDHWSSAQRFTPALGMDWIAPRQALGAVHRAFAANVRTNGTLYIWPSALSTAAVGGAEIVKCTGTGKNRNHSGLAMIVQNPTTGGPQMLFPGDSRYSAIPRSNAGSFTGVVAPHHGADMKQNVAPPCSGQPPHRIVYSYGAGNTWRHPRAATINLHVAAGWSNRLDTAVRSQATSTGHVVLTWNGSPVPPPTLSPPCQTFGSPSGTRCDLAITKG